MKDKIAGFIVRFRAVWLIFLLAASVLAALSVGRTRVNYDLTAYLNEDTDTRRGLELMKPTSTTEPASGSEDDSDDESKEEGQEGGEKSGKPRKKVLENP